MATLADYIHFGDWTQEVFQGDPSDNDIEDTPSLLFSTQRKLVGPRKFSVSVPGYVSQQPEKNGFKFAWPDETSNHHKHHRFIQTNWFTYGGHFTFAYTTDDGCRIFVDNKLLDPVGDRSSWRNQDKTAYVAIAYVSAGEHTIRVEYYNHNDEGDLEFAYAYLSMNRNDYKQRPSDQPTEPPGEQPPASLVGVITLNPEAFQKNYTKGTLTNPSAERISLTNTSQVYTVDVTLHGISGVGFNPSIVRLAPNEVKYVDVEFNSVEIESLEAGINRVTCVLDVVAVDANTQQPPPPTEDTTQILSIVSGNNQTGVVNRSLGQLLIVSMKNSQGIPLYNNSVQWQVLSGGGALDASTSMTTQDGVAVNVWTLGPSDGSQSVQAFTDDSRVVFYAYATQRSITPPDTGGGTPDDRARAT